MRFDLQVFLEPVWNRLWAWAGLRRPCRNTRRPCWPCSEPAPSSPNLPDSPRPTRFRHPRPRSNPAGATASANVYLKNCSHHWGHCPLCRLRGQPLYVCRGQGRIPRGRLMFRAEAVPSVSGKCLPAPCGVRFRRIGSGSSWSRPPARATKPGCPPGLSRSDILRSGSSDPRCPGGSGMQWPTGRCHRVRRVYPASAGTVGGPCLYQ